ncbi:hypothetical protein ADUPG1_011701, partial [Aduncisulcus paluster]
DYGGWFTHVFIPFFPSNRMKGAYISIMESNLFYSPPSHLFFTFKASNGKIITSKKFKFPELTHKTWYYLPIDLFDVSMCVIEGKGRRAGKEDFILSSLIFIREETPEESITRKIQKYSLEKLWTDSPLVLAESLLSKKVKTYADIPIEFDSMVISPMLSLIRARNDSKNPKHHEEVYDVSLDVQNMFVSKVVYNLELSHLSIPFPSPSPMKGAYICVNKLDSSPQLLFTFTDCDGKMTSKKYEFTEPKPKIRFEWFFLPIDLPDVVLCEIEGKGRWAEEKSRWFKINSLVFVRSKELVSIEELCLLPWK